MLYINIPLKCFTLSCSIVLAVRKYSMWQNPFQVHRSLCSARTPRYHCGEELLFWRWWHKGLGPRKSSKHRERASLQIDFSSTNWRSAPMNEGLLWRWKSVGITVCECSVKFSPESTRDPRQSTYLSLRGPLCTSGQSHVWRSLPASRSAETLLFSICPHATLA